MAAATELLELTCPGCGRATLVEATRRKASCSLCQEVIRVPGPALTAPVAAPIAAQVAAPGPAENLPDSLFEPPAAHRRSRAVTPAPMRESSSSSRDLETEAHLVAIAIWQRVWCVLGLIFAFALYKLTVSLSAHFGMTAPGALRVVAMPVLGALASGALGHYLARYHAPARLLTVGLAGLTVAATLWSGISFLSIVSCLFDVAVIVVLVNPRSVRVCTPEYRDEVARTADVSVPWASSPFFWIPAVLTLLLVGVALFSALATAALMR